MGALGVEKPSATKQSSPNIEESTPKRSLTSVRSVGKPFIITVNAGLMNEDTLGISPIDVGLWENFPRSTLSYHPSKNPHWRETLQV